MGKYLFVPVHGEVKTVTLPDPLSLKDVKALIGCDSIETVSVIQKGVRLLIDDCGKIHAQPKPVNVRASNLYFGSLFGDYIVGDVLLCQEKECSDGIDLVGFDEKRLQHLRHVVSFDD